MSPASSNDGQLLPPYRNGRSLLGESEAMQTLCHVISTVSDTAVTTMLIGETGTGKELVARALHAGSPHAEGRFVALNCGGLADGVLQSELFGHERGAFTGAVQGRDGRFTQANGGTLFLDEIGDIGPTTQATLLRVLQERTFERVGGNITLSTNARVISATHRDLRAEVRAGRFRTDLYYRLCVVEIAVPALRSRLEDVPELSQVFLRCAASHRRPCVRFTEAAMRCLVAHAWPGNVRELENAVEHAVVFSSGPEVQVDDLPAYLRRRIPSPAGLRIPGATLAEIQAYAVGKTLEATGGSTKRAAEILKISQRKVQYALRG